MNLAQPVSLLVISTVVRFILSAALVSYAFIAPVNAAPADKSRPGTMSVTAAKGGLADAQREQQQLRHMSQWNALMLLGLDDCRGALRIDLALAHSRPEQYLLASDMTSDGDLMRADFVRQQMYCRVQNDPTMHLQLENKLRHLVPNLPLLAPQSAGTVNASYAQALAVLLALQWLADRNDTSALVAAKNAWLTSPLAALYSPVWRLHARPNTSLSSLLAAALNGERSIAHQGLIE